MNARPRHRIASARVAVLVAAAVAAVATGCSSGTGASTTTTVAPAPKATTTTAASGHDAMAEDDTTADRPTNATFDGAARAQLAAQLVQARAIAMRYPTVADALAAGYELTTPYAPGTGAHYGKDSDTQPPGAKLDVAKPQSLLYDGTEPTSKVVGLMYVQLGGDTAPDGFAGPLDTWSPFPGQCLKPGTTDPVFPTKDSVTKRECDDVHGTFIDVTAWIQHVWVVPGWEAPGGVFAPYNADIVCADGAAEPDPVKGCDPPTSTPAPSGR